MFEANLQFCEFRKTSNLADDVTRVAFEVLNAVCVEVAEYNNNKTCRQTKYSAAKIMCIGLTLFKNLKT